ncbi:hypothetical protein ACQKEI_03465 [Psychrobacter namhaensis]|uniref:hypothetical protein n=1 Tax=Psychrobacter namhaensis TaxID=292734 RepID=UPI003CFC7C7C
MKSNTLSLIMGAALVLPSLAMAMPVNKTEVTPADKRVLPVDNTLQAKIEGPNGELLATQPGAVEVNNGSALGMTDTATSASVNTGKVTPADMRTTPAPNTLKAKIQGPDGELIATQPGEVELNNGSASGMTDTAAAASVNTGEVTPADMRSTPAPNTLKAKIQGPDGELIATQPGEVQLNESRRLVVR